MKKYLFIIGLISLAGCSKILTKESIEVCEKSCSTNEGLDHIYVENNSITCICTNGAEFTVHQEYAGGSKAIKGSNK